MKSLILRWPWIISIWPVIIISCCCCSTIAQQPSEKTDTSLGNGQLVQERKDSDSSVPRNQVDIDALLDAVGMPRCIEHCISSLRPELVLILGLNDTFDQFQRICQHFHSARKCVHSSACLSANLFDTVASGLQSLCDEKKQQFITKNGECLRRVLDETSQQCEKKCHFIQALANFSHRPDLKGLGVVHLLGMLEHLGEVCRAADCYLPCYRDGLNSACPKAGGVILDGLLRPFYQLANFIQKGGIGVRNFVDEKVPKSCHFLTEKEPLDKLVNPKKA